MLRKTIALTIAVALLQLACYIPIKAATYAKPNEKFVAQVKSKIARLGTGPDARIEVKLRDKTKVEGYVSAIDEETFSLTDLATRSVTSIAYSQVKTVKGRNLSTGAKIGIGIGVVAAAFLVIYVLLRSGAVQDD